MNKFNIDINKIDFKKLNGIIPVCIQDSKSLQVLMIGFMNEQALSITLETKKVTFWSRTKKRLWTKGETSGNYLQLDSLLLDCDNDSLLIYSTAMGPACHTGEISCFKNNNIKDNSLLFIFNLLERINDRYNNPQANSYTSALFSKGVKKIAQKVGEEAVEVSIAAVVGDRRELKQEIADLLYHLFVLMCKSDVSLSNIVEVLKTRAK